MPSAAAPGDPHKQPADTPPEPGAPEDAAVARIAALTRAVTAAEAAEEFLTISSPATVPTVDTTDLERTLNLSSQYASQLHILRESAVLQNLPSGQEGINDIDSTFHPVPTLPEIRSALSRQPYLKEKVVQGFTRLLIVPFGMSLNDLRDAHKETLLAVDQAGGLKDSHGNPVPLDRSDPFYTWEMYAGANTYDTLLYGIQAFSPNHQGKTKSDLLSSSPSGFQVLLVEDIVGLPSEGEGMTIGSRPQLTCNRTSEEYLHELKTNPIYRHETGLVPEAYIALAITRLRENGTVLDKGTYSFLTGAYFPRSDDVPLAFFHSSIRQAGLSGSGPGLRSGNCGARVGVRVL